MYFNRKNAEQKNWRMIKKGKHFLFGCSLVFAVGAALVAPTVKADTADTGEVETKTANSAAEASSSDEVGTYKAPAVEVSTTSPVVAENPTSSEAASAKTAKEADGIQLPSLTVVADSSVLTDEEKANVVEAVKGVNPTATDVQVQADGSVVVTFADGSTANLSAAQTVKVAAPAETSATQPKSRSRRAAGQERAQDRSAEGKDINFEYRSRKKIEDGDPTQRAKIEYRQLGDYEVVDGKTVATDPAGQGRPVLEWTVTFNEAQYDLMGGYYYFTIPKNVSDPYNVVTEYNNGAYRPRDGWVDGNVTAGGSPSAEGQQFIDAGNKLNWRVGNTVGNINSVPGLSGVMDQTEKVYVLGFANNTKARKVTIKYRTVVTDPSQVISYIAGVDSKTGALRNNWYGLTGKYDKHLVSQVDAPKVTPNLTNTSVNVPIQTVASTSSTLSGTGVPGATIKLYIDGKEQNIGNVTVDNSGNWTTGELPTALNNNQGDGTTIKPRQTVEVSQVVNGEESSRRTVPVSVGVTTVEPSSLTTNQDAVVAGQKEVTLKVPHDAGIAYMRYTDTSGQVLEIPVKRDSASAAWTSQKSDKATVKSVEHGKFQDTIVLTMADKIAGVEVAAISNVVEGGFSSVADWQTRSVENQAPTIASAVEGNNKTVAQGAQLDLASLVTVADKEDDAQATLGDKVHAEVVSVNGNTATKTVDTNTQGTYTVKYKAVDSQGKESNEIEVTVVVNPARDNAAPTVEIPYSDPAPNKKEVYLYTGEDADVDITFNDDSGKIKSASLKKGGNIALNDIDGNPDKQDNEYGYTVTAINSETATPAKIKVTGQVSGIAAEKLPKTENDSLDLVTRFATATDTDGALINNTAVKTKKNGEVVGSYLTDPGAVTFVLKAQTKKYDIKVPEEKLPVADANNVTDKEFEKIKEKVKVEYSQNNPDARLADKKGQEVEDASKVVDKVEKDGNNVVVTYKDGSKDTKPLTDFARTNVAPTVEIPYSDPAPNKKEVYLYTGEEADVDITFNDDSGKIKSASLKKGGNIALNNIDGNPDKQDNEYGYTVTAINSETATPAKIKVTGQVSGISAEKLPKTENDSLDLVTRFATATDTDGELINNTAVKTKKNGEVVGSYLTDPGAVTFVLKAQTKKYDIKTPSETDKVTVSDANNVTDKEFEKIKEKVKVEYSQNNPDARLADKKGQEVEDASKVVDKVEKDGNNVVVTYKDGSKDTKPLSEFVNVAPKVEVPYSNEANKQIYVYTGENTDLTFKASDNTAVKDMYVRGPGGIGKDNTADYGFTTGKIENSAVTHGDGTVSGSTATIKMTGVTTLKAPNHWTSFVVAKDNNDAESTTDFRALDQNPNATQTPGYVHFIVKSQTDKYDIATPAPADKVEVADPTKVTDAELDKIKEKLQLEYNKNNDDANIAKNTPVDKDGKIQSVTNDGKGNLVVTYKDGSTDTKPLTEFVTQKPATPDTEAPAKPVVADLTGKAGTKDPVKVNAEPGSTVELFDKDGKKIGEGVADDKGKATITPTEALPEGDVTAKATDKAGNVSEPSEPAKATPAKATPDTEAPAKPVVADLTGKAGTTDPVEVTAEPGSKVELFDKDGKKIGEGVADDKGKATITPKEALPEGDVTAKATDKAGNVSEPSDPAKATPAKETPDTEAPAKPVVADLTGKAGTTDPVEVTAEPGSKVELFDKDGKKIGEGVADDKGKATITPKEALPEGDVTAKATDKAGNVSEPSDPAKATPAKETPDTEAPAKPVVADLTGKAGTTDPVEVTAEPGSKVELFDKDGKKIGEGVADDKGKATITPKEALPEGDVTAKATDKAGNVSEPSDPAKATPAKETPDTEAPAKPVVADLTGKAGTTDPVEVTAEPGSKVELFDKDGKKIGEGVADDKGKATITPKEALPEGDVTAKATDKAGNVSEPSDPAKATPAKETPDTEAPAKPVVADLTGKAGTTDPVEVTAEPGSKVELFDKDGKKIGEGVADDKGKATITPKEALPEGDVTAKATDKAGNVSEPSDPAKATPAKETPDTEAPAKPVVADLTGKAGTTDPVEVTAEPGSKVELFDKDGKKIGEGVADDKGKATITPKEALPEGDVTAKATDKAGNVSEPSDPAKATPDTEAPAKPVVADLTGKAGTTDPVEVTAEPGSKVELFDKDGKKIGEGVADDKGKATITPTEALPEGDVTAKATDKAGNVSEPSDPAKATPAKETPDTEAPAKPVVADLTGKAGTTDPVEVTAEPGSKVELFDKDGKKIGEGVADDKGKATITPKEALPEGDVTAKATDKAGNVSEPSEPAKATPAKETPDTEAPAKPVVADLTGKAGTTDPVEVTAEPGSKVELFDKDGKKIGEGVADDKGKATITPTEALPEGDVTAKATDKAGNVSEPSEPAKATPAKETPDTEAPAKPVVADLTGKAGTTDPVEVTAEPGSKVELFDKDGKKIGEGVADDKGKATITPKEALPEGDVTAKATDKAGNVSEPSDPAKATPAKETPDTEAPAKPVVADLTGKAGTTDPVEVTAEPGSKVELFDKDGKKIGEGVADDKGKATITPKEALPEGDVTAKATDKAGNVSEPSDPAKATPAKETPDTEAPAKPVVADLTGKAGTTDPVEVTAEPGSKVELFDKDGKKIGEGVADDKGKATITPKEALPEGDVTAKATDKAGNVSEPSDPAKATPAKETPDTEAPAKPVVADLTGKAGTTDPVEVTAEPGSKVELFDKDGKKIGEGVADDKGKATITPTEALPEGDVTAKATDKAGNVSEPSDPAKATPAKATPDTEAPAKPVVADLTGKAGTTDPVEVTAEPGSKVELFDKDGKKIGEGVADDKGKATITPTEALPEGDVTAKATDKAGNVSEPSDPAKATPAKATPDTEAPAKPVVADLTGKAGTTDPVEVTAEPGSKVELFDKDGKKIGEGVADDKGKATITPTEALPEGDVTAKATDKAGNVSEPSVPAKATKVPDKELKDPAVTPVVDPSNLTDAEKAKVAEEVKKSNPTAKDVEVGKDGTATVTFPDGSTAVIPSGDTVKKSSDNAVKDPAVTPVVDPSNLTDAEKAKVAEEVKKSNPTAKDVEVGKDGTATVTFPDGSTAVIPSGDTVKKSSDNAVKDPSVTPVVDPSNLTDAEKAKVAGEVKKSNPTAKDVEVGKDGTATVTFPDGTTAVIPADKTVKKSADKAVKDPSVTPVTDPSNLTDAEKAKVADEVKKSNPTAKDVEVGKDGTTTVTYPDGTTAVIPADKTVKKSADKAVKDPSVTPVTDPSNLTDAEKAKVADEVKKSNPTVSKVEVGNDGTTTVTYPDGTTAVIPADKTVKKSADKAVKDPSVTPVTDPSNLTDAEKAKVADEVKKSNPTAKDVEVGKDGTTTVTYPDGTTAVIPADKTVKKSADKAVKDPSVTPVTDPSNLTDAEKAKVADEVKKSNPTAKDVEVGKDGTTTVTYPDGTTAVIPADKTVKKSADKAVKDPSVTPVTDPSNLTDAEKAKVAEEVKKSNPTAKDVEVGKDGTTTVTYPDGTTAVIPADKTVKKSADKAVKDPSVTPVTDPSNLTDAEKAKVAEEVKKSNPTAKDVEVGKDGTTTVTYPDGTTAVIPADKTVKKSDDKGTKDPSVTPVTDPSNLTDAEKAKVAEEVKKSNPTVTDVKVDKDGTTTVTYPDGTTAVIPVDKTVKKSDDKVVTDPTVTPVTDPSNLTDAEKAKVADDVKKSNPTVSKVEVGNDGTTTVTYPDGTTAVIPADKTVKKSDDKAVKDPSVTPVTDPSNLTDAEKAKVGDEVKKANPTVSKVEVGNDGTTTVTYPDGTTAVIPADKTVKKSNDKAVKDPSVTPVTDPSNLTDAEKAKVADDVKKSNPTVSKVEVGNDGTTTVTYPDGTTAVIPADKTVKKSDDKAVKDPSVTPVTDPSNLTDAEKAKVGDEVKKANPTVSKVEVGNDGTTTVTYPDGTTAVIPADKTVKKSNDKAVKDPSVTPVTDPSNLTDAEKAKVAEEVKKANPTAKDVEVGKDGTATVTFPDGSTAVIPSGDTVKKSSDNAVKDPAVTPVVDPSNLTDAEKAKVAEEVKKANPTAKDVEVGKDGTATVTFPDGSTAVIPSGDTVKKSSDNAVKDPAVTPVVDPSNLTDAEKAKVAEEVKKANPTAKDIKVNKDGSVVVTFKDGTTSVIPADKTVKKSSDKVKESDGVKNPSVTPVTDPSNLTDAEKAKVAEEVKKSNPTAKDIKVNKDGSVVVTFKDGTKAVIPADKTVKKSSDKVKESDGVKNPSVTPVTDPSNLTDAEKAKVAEEVKKSNPTAKDIKVNKDGSVVVTFKDGTKAVIPADKTVKKSSDKVKESDGVKNPSVTPVTDPSNLTDAEKAKVAEEVKKSNPTAKDIKVNKDGSVVVTFEDGTTSVIPADKTVKKSDGSVAVNPATNQDSPAQAPAKKAGAKELPNTGTEQSSASLALALLAAATGGLLFAKKREEEE